MRECQADVRSIARIEDKNARAELIWRLLIATMKMSIHNISLFSYAKNTHNIHIFVSSEMEHIVET